MKVGLCNGQQISLTDAQYYTAKEWCWRTKDDDAEEFHFPAQVFPARDNIDNGYRRCCARLVEARVLRGNPDIGYVLDTAIRHYMMDRL